MVTHDAAAAAIADRILFLADGLIAHELARSRAGGDPGHDATASRVTRVALAGLARPEAPDGADRARDRARRRDGHAAPTSSPTRSRARSTGSSRRSTAAPTRPSPASRRSASRTTAARPRRRSTSRCSRRCARCPTSQDADRRRRRRPRTSSGRTARRSRSAARRTSASASTRREPQFNPLTLVDGAWPKADELVVDRSTAEQEAPRGRADDRRRGERADAADADLGPRQVRRRLEPRRRDARRSSTCRPRRGSSTSVGKLDQIRAKAKAGVDAAAARRREIQRILPPGTQVRTGEAQAKEDATDTTSFLGFLQKFLLAFGGIALFVGVFVIANSLSITIAQRTREFATLRTLGASRRQVLTLDHRRGARGRRARLGRRRPRRLRPRARPLQALRRRRLHAAEQRRSSSRRARSSSRCSSASSSRCSRACGPALRATRVPPIAAVREGATLPEGRFAPLPHARERRPHAPRVRGARLRALRARASARRDPALDGRRHRPASSSASRCCPRGIARPLAERARLARVEDRRRRRRARARQRAAQPAAHRVDRLRADDRPRARDARRGARGRHHLELQGRRQRPLDERLRGDRARTTSRRSRSPPATRRRRRPACRRSPTCAAATRAAFGKTIQATGINPEAVGIFNLDWVDGSDAVFAQARRARRDRRQGLREEARPRASGRRCSLLTPNGTVLPLQVRGIFDPPTGRLPVRPRHDLRRSLGSRLRRPAEHLHVRAHAGRRDRRERGRAREAARVVPEREGADEAAVHRQPDRGAERDPQRPLRPARAVGGREPLRDREHARADRLRAHARARHAAGDRDDAPPGAPDDPAREHHHRADRRRDRHRPRPRARRRSSSRGSTSSCSRCPWAS